MKRLAKLIIGLAGMAVGAPVVGALFGDEPLLLGGERADPPGGVAVVAWRDQPAPVAHATAAGALCTVGRPG